MATPFDLLDLFLPEIAQWIAGKSSSQIRRFRRAGLGLLLLGGFMGLGALAATSFMVWAFTSLHWALFVSFLFMGCGIGLLLCLRYDKTF
jgi:hypothetical protein